MILQPQRAARPARIDPAQLAVLRVRLEAARTQALPHSVAMRAAVAALDRIADGSYGVCECGAPLPHQALLIDPTRLLCETCRQVAETDLALLESSFGHRPIKSKAKF